MTAEFIQRITDRPIAFQRSFVTLGAGITGALMLSQAVYWSGRTSDSDGWFYKSRDDWEEETGLTRREQETARTRLKGIGVLEEALRGVPATVNYRVNFSNLAKHLGVPSSWHESAQLDGTEAPNQMGGKRPTNTETTQETTAETTPKQGQFIEFLPNWINHEDWTAFEEHRRAMKAKLTAEAAKRIVKKLATFRAAGHDPNLILSTSIENGWKGVFAPKPNGRHPPPTDLDNPQNVDRPYHTRNEFR